MKLSGILLIITVSYIAVTKSAHQSASSEVSASAPRSGSSELVPLSRKLNKT